MYIYRIQYDNGIFDFVIQANNAQEAISISKNILIEKCNKTIDEMAQYVKESERGQFVDIQFKQKMEYNEKMKGEDITALYLIGKLEN